jgi:hypothetical protein
MGSNSMGKLTLSIDQELIEAAKAYAKTHHTSLSQLVTRCFRELASQPADAFFSQLHTELQRDGFDAPRGDLSALRQQHITRKYM